MIIIQDDRSSSFKKKNTKKQESFIIVNTDNSGGLYIHNVVNTLVNSGLQQQDARFGSKRVKAIRLLDAIVVGDCTAAFDYDFRVVKQKHLDTLDELDGRTFKVYDVVEDYSKILNKIKAYAKANRIGEYKYYKQRCCFGRRRPQQQPEQVHVHVNVKYDEKPKPVFKKRDYCSVKRVDPIRYNEKVTFFSDWVKIGMHQFDIECDVLGNQYIEDGGRNKYYIGEDRCGNRHLMVTR